MCAKEVLNVETIKLHLKNHTEKCCDSKGKLLRGVFYVIFRSYFLESL